MRGAKTDRMFFVRWLGPFLFAVTVLLAPLFRLALPVAAQPATAQKTTHVFFSVGCADCWPYAEGGVGHVFRL